MFGKLLQDLGWRALVLVIAAGVAGWAARRGRPSGSLLLPAAGAAIALANIGRTASRLPASAPELRAQVLNDGWRLGLLVPVITGVLGIALLPAIRGAGRDGLTVATAVVGALLPLFGVSLRLGHAHFPWPFPVAAALAMAIGGALLARPRRSDTPRAHVALVYATFATLIAAASVPDVFAVPMGHHTAIQPELRCLALRDLLAAGLRAAVWALASTPLALGPLWVEARRDGRLRWAAGVSAALVVLALGLSAFPLVWLTRGALLEGCPAGPRAW